MRGGVMEIGKSPNSLRPRFFRFLSFLLFGSADQPKNKKKEAGSEYSVVLSRGRDEELEGVDTSCAQWRTPS